MKIGSIDLGERPVFLAPMEDVTDPAFRLLCKKFGADMVYTEFISADALIRSVKRTEQKLTIHDEERPVAIQLYGREADAMSEAARIAEEANPEIIDLNFGCPVKKVAGKGAGAGLLRNIPKMLEITTAVVKAVKKPVTVKTRLGWDEDNKIIVDLAEKAMKSLGIKPLIKPIRGGTDGCRLSYMGLPCPNIFAGGHNFHGKYEYVPVESMQKAVDVIVKIAQLTATTDFSKKKKSKKKK